MLLVDTSESEDSVKFQCTNENSQIYMFMVMPEYGTTLFDMFDAKRGTFTSQSIYSLGVQLLNILEQIHAAGFVFNDLKLDNLMFDASADKRKIKKSDGDIFEHNNVNIIDFGFATPYLKEDGRTHVKKTHLESFRGNLVFSSLNQLKFQSTSRRDDLISLFYLMVYLFKQGQMPGINLAEGYDQTELFKTLFQVRQTQTSKELCFGNTQGLKEFKREVFSYHFADEPNYDKLR